MQTYKNLSHVKPGIYGSLKPLDLVSVDQDNPYIEGISNAAYVRIPTLLALVFSPFMGAAFVMLFPLLVILSIIYAIGRFLYKPVHYYIRTHLYLFFPRHTSLSTSYLIPPDEDEMSIEDSEN